MPLCDLMLVIKSFFFDLSRKLKGEKICLLNGIIVNPKSHVYGCHDTQTSTGVKAPLQVEACFCTHESTGINVINVRFTSCDEQTDISSKNFKNLYFHLIKNLNHRVFVPNTDLYMPHRIHI